MLTIGKVARRVGIRPSAIRYYERQGMLQPTVRGANGYRTYSDDAVKLLLFVKRAQSLGITLKEIKPSIPLPGKLISCSLNHSNKWYSIVGLRFWPS